MQFLDLLLGDLELLEACGDLLKRQKAALLPLRDETTELIEFRDRCLVTEQSGCLVAQPPTPSGSRISNQEPLPDSGSLSLVSPLKGPPSDTTDLRLRANRHNLPRRRCSLMQGHWS